MDYLRIGFLFLILGSGILFLIRKLHFSQHLAPLVTILGDTTILYIFSLLNQLQIGIVITVVLNLLLGLFSFIKFPKIGQNEKLIFSPAIILWIFIFVSLIAYTRGTLFYGWDEFTYWGVIYKYLMTTNHLPDLSSNFFITNYPPFAALFQYCVGKIIGNKESSAYFAQMLMAFSAVIAVFPKSIWSKWKKYGIAIALGVLSIFALDFTIQYLHVDLMIGLLFAAALTSVSFEDHISSDRLVSLLLISVALTLI